MFYMCNKLLNFAFCPQFVQIVFILFSELVGLHILGGFLCHFICTGVSFCTVTATIYHLGQLILILNGEKWARFLFESDTTPVALYKTSGLSEALYLKLCIDTCVCKHESGLQGLVKAFQVGLERQRHSIGFTDSTLWAIWKRYKRFSLHTREQNSSADVF